MTKKPLIGITFDSKGPGGYSKFPWYALRENYCSAVADVGGVPFPLIHDLSLLDVYISSIDALVITGGDYDIDPSLYGSSTCHPTIKVKPTRTTFEMAITQKALDKNIPVLGICGGQQLLNVLLGGTLIQHIPDEIPDALAHEQPNPRDEPGHTIKILKDSYLHQLIQKEVIDVNSAHHQAVKEVGKNAIVNALAPDGVIEGFEVPQYKFCLGLQWHPEFSITPHDVTIFRALIEKACD